MMEKFHKICISCPAGCHLEISRDADRIEVSGNRCPRGEKYAVTELTDPRRVVTAVVFSGDGKRKCIPVRSTAPVPMGEIPGLLKRLFALRVELPVEMGQIILPDASAGGIHIVATSTCR